MVLKYCLKTFKYTIEDIINDIDLPEVEKKVIMKRYVEEVIRSERTSSIICVLYFVMRFAITIGGVLMTSLLLLTKLSIINKDAENALFWICWGLSLLVGLANESIYAFGLDKKFYVNTMILEKLKSEGWQFIELTGRYQRFLTHKLAYKEFVYRIERLKIANVIHNLEIHEEETRLTKKESHIELRHVDNENVLTP